MRVFQKNINRNIFASAGNGKRNRIPNSCGKQSIVNVIKSCYGFILNNRTRCVRYFYMPYGIVNLKSVARIRNVNVFIYFRLSGFIVIFRSARI